MTTKNSKEVAQAFQWIYENTPLPYPKTLIVDDGKEFYGDTTKLMEKHDVMIQHGDPSPRPNASMSLFAKPNDIHQSDLLSLPHDKFKKKTYKYALNIMDVASRYKGSYPLTTRNSKEVAQAFQWIYENTPLPYPKTLIVDDGKEFYGDTTKLIEKHYVMIQREDPSQHRSQGIVERFNRMLADRLFSYQYLKELEDPSKSNREWVSRLQNVVSVLNNEKTSLIGMKPVDAIKETLV